MDSDDAFAGCCHVPHGCVFTKALQSRIADCVHATRRSVGEATALDCLSPPAQANCQLLAALLHERARFALKLGAGGQPLRHVQALRLQCGGLLALQRQLGPASPGGTPARVACVHGLVGQAQARHGSLTELPWPQLVADLARWAPRQRATGRAP
ncbi:MAG: hypothetical protein JNL30_07510 [Rubrivivax sp.]|nr:hypothetical protein [Rubrivivax sp.]